MTALGAVLPVPAAATSEADAAFIVSNYPVQATAKNGVAAKEKAVAEGQQAAFRSLVKRLTPVTAYKAYSRLGPVRAGDLISEIAVRSERGSSTSYTASLDFVFQPQRVRDLLLKSGVAFIDQQAPETALVLIYLPPVSAGPADLAQSAGASMWWEAWNGLDLEHALTPVKLHKRPAALTADIVKAALRDPNAPLRAIAALSKSGQALLAIAEADPAARRLHVVLTGTDAVGSFVLKRAWRMDPSDPAYAAELAAVVALATIEGRWKATRGASAPPANLPLQQVQLVIEYRSLEHWQKLQHQIAVTPGVEDFLIAGLTTRGADASLRYPGGGERLSAALAGQGIELRNSGGIWFARAPN
ncbi:MAG: DUF2066 domain-containing protein [Hyphomicrobiaceae bacterium]